MKNILVILFVWVFAQKALGQGVGINITTPTSTLDVGGDVRVRNLPDSVADFNVTADSLGNFFRNSNQSYSNNCGLGFLDVPGNNYSIEINERPGTTWFNAVNICRSIGARLCTWEEWYYACSISLPLFNMTVNYFEWTSDNTGSLTVLGVGNSSCGSMSSQVPSAGLNFRCCCDK